MVLPANLERMFVLGIDPGLSRCGYGVVEHAGARDATLASGMRPLSNARAVTAGVITTERSSPLHLRLGSLLFEVRALVEELRPGVVVVERVFFQTNALTAMSVAQAAGVALAVAADAGCEVAQYTANEVKQAVAGYGSASKQQVQRMVASLLGLDEPPRPPDVADALALALCHVASLPIREAVAAALDRGERR